MPIAVADEQAVKGLIREHAASVQNGTNYLRWITGICNETDAPGASLFVVTRCLDELMAEDPDLTARLREHLAGATP